jgi:hypothetical protein
LAAFGVRAAKVVAAVGPEGEVSAEGLAVASARDKRLATAKRRDLIFMLS